MTVARMSAKISVALRLVVSTLALVGSLPCERHGPTL